MMELKKITDNVYYIPGSVNIGVIKDSDSSILIDSGLDEDNGKKILRILKENNLSVKAIVNTHSHADHCGANRYVREMTKAKIYAPQIEADIIQYSLIEPLYLFSGARPLKELENKFLMAQPSSVDYVITEKQISFNENRLSVIPLLGHSPNQIGIEVDNVLFCADSLFSKEIIEKHKIPFFIDIDKERETLDFLKRSKYKYYVPSHAEPKEDITELTELNIQTIDGVEKNILDTLKESRTTEQVLKSLCDNYKIEIKTAQQYYLMNTTAMAYLSSLHGREKIKLNMDGNFLFWKKL